MNAGRELGKPPASHLLCNQKASLLRPLSPLLSSSNDPHPVQELYSGSVTHIDCNVPGAPWSWASHTLSPSLLPHPHTSSPGRQTSPQIRGHKVEICVEGCSGTGAEPGLCPPILSSSSVFGLLLLLLFCDSSNHTLSLPVTDLMSPKNAM